MKVWTSHMLARSLAGHDRGRLYVVLSCDPDYYLLSDGKYRTLDAPKKKNRKHVQVITHLPDELLLQMREFTEDAQVRKILKSYETGLSR